MPGHEEARLPAVAGLAGYLITTAVLVVPVLLVARRGRAPRGSVTAMLVGIATLSAAVAEFRQPYAPLAALAAGVAVEAVESATTRRSSTWRLIAIGATVPAVLWPAQLLGVAATTGVGWPVELWSGVVVISTATAALLGYLTVTGGRAYGPSELAVTERPAMVREQSGRWHPCPRDDHPRR